MADHYASDSSAGQSETEEQQKPPPTTAFQIIVGVGMIGSFLILGLVVGRMEAQGAVAAASSPPASGSTTTTTTTATAAEPAAPASAPATPAVGTAAARSSGEGLTGEVKAIEARLDGLSAQLKGLEGKLEGLSKSGPVSDPRAMQGKVEELARSIAAVVPVSEKVGELGGRVEAVDTALKAFKDEVSGLTAEVKKLTTAESGPMAGDPRIAEAIDLFKAGKYKEADELFKKVPSTDPVDARVYYYEAFANALTTNDWKGETLKLAARAAALEKAGTPKRSAVDAAFADLPDTLKPWLAYFRNHAHSP